MKAMKVLESVNGQIMVYDEKNSNLLSFSDSNNAVRYLMGEDVPVNVSPVTLEEMDALLEEELTIVAEDGKIIDFGCQRFETLNRAGWYAFDKHEPTVTVNGKAPTWESASDIMPYLDAENVQELYNAVYPCTAEYFLDEYLWEYGNPTLVKTLKKTFNLGWIEGCIWKK